MTLTKQMFEYNLSVQRPLKRSHDFSAMGDVTKFYIVILWQLITFTFEKLLY